MASAEAIAELREKIGDDTEPYTYPDEVLNALIDQADGDTDQVASGIWRRKAASYAEMVDVSEAGSSRKNSDLFKNATAMADWYGNQGGSEGGLPGVDYTTTRRIVRP